MKPIPNFECYSATKEGDIYRTSYPDEGNRAKYYVPYKLIPSCDKDGYKKVILSIKGKCYYKRVHRLIAITFIPNPDNLPLVNHIDGDKKNNSVNNLEWVSHQDNVIHAHKTGLHKGCRTGVTLDNGREIKHFDSLIEAAKYLGHCRDCFRRHLTTDSRHGEIDGWLFELIGGKNRREVIKV